MKLTRRQLNRIIQESLLNEMTPDIIGTSGDARAASRQANMSNVPHELLRAVVEVVPPFGEISDAGFALHHGKKGVEKTMAGDEEGAREEFKEAGTYAAFFFVPGVVEFLLKTVRRLMKTLKSADEVLEAALKEAKDAPELRPSPSAKTYLEPPKNNNVRLYSIQNWDLDYYSHNADHFNANLKDALGMDNAQQRLAFTKGKYKGWTPIGIDKPSGQLMIMKGGKGQAYAISQPSAEEGIKSNPMLQVLFARGAE